MKQKSANPKETGHGSKLGRYKLPGNRELSEPVHAESTSNPNHNTDESSHDQTALERSELNRIKELPKEVGVMLVTAGILGLILPGPGTPAIIAGGLALWPNAFGKLESWLEERHPGIHRKSMQQICRFLNDLEKRYPYSATAKKQR